MVAEGGSVGLPEQCQADVDEDICAAAGDEEHANGRDCGEISTTSSRRWQASLRGKRRLGIRTEEGDEDLEDEAARSHFRFYVVDGLFVKVVNVAVANWFSVSEVESIV